MGDPRSQQRTRAEKARWKAIQPELRSLEAQYKRLKRQQSEIIVQMNELRLSSCPYENVYNCPFYNTAHDVCTRGTGHCVCPNSPEYRPRRHDG